MRQNDSREWNSLSVGEMDFFNAINSDVRTLFDVGARTDTFYLDNPPFGIKKLSLEGHTCLSPTQDFLRS